MGAQDVEGVGVTAVAVAAARALESTRPDALVRDPWAAGLVRASGMSLPYPDRWPDDPAAEPLVQSLLLGALYIGLRTRFIDDEVRRGALAQIVILGSGLDTRPWRLDLAPRSVVFALDSAPVHHLVSSAITDEPRCRLVPIVADVTAPWTADIVRAGFDPRTPTQWVVEGLLPYLGAEDQGALLDDIVHLSAPGSRAVIERATSIEDGPEARERLAAFAAATGIPMHEVLARADPPDPAAALSAAGWDAQSHAVADLERRYSRRIRLDPSDPAPSASRGGFVTAVGPA